MSDEHDHQIVVPADETSRWATLFARLDHLCASDRRNTDAHDAIHKRLDAMTEHCKGMHANGYKSLARAIGHPVWGRVLQFCAIAAVVYVTRGRTRTEDVAASDKRIADDIKAALYAAATITRELAPLTAMATDYGYTTNKTEAANGGH